MKIAYVILQIKHLSNPPPWGRKDKIMKLLYDGEEIGEIMTNRSLSLTECLDLLGIDIDAQEGGDPMWDYALFKMIY